MRSPLPPSRPVVPPRGPYTPAWALAWFERAEGLYAHPLGPLVDVDPVGLFGATDRDAVVQAALAWQEWEKPTWAARASYALPVCKATPTTPGAFSARDGTGWVCGDVEPVRAGRGRASIPRLGPYPDLAISYWRASIPWHLDLHRAATARDRTALLTMLQRERTNWRAIQGRRNTRVVLVRGRATPRRDDELYDRVIDAGAHAEDAAGNPVRAWDVLTV